MNYPVYIPVIIVLHVLPWSSSEQRGILGTLAAMIFQLSILTITG